MEWACRYDPKRGDSGYLKGVGDTQEGVFVLLKHFKEEKEASYYEDRIKDMASLLKSEIRVRTELRYRFEIFV